MLQLGVTEAVVLDGTVVRFAHSVKVYNIFRTISNHHSANRDRLRPPTVLTEVRISVSYVLCPTQRLSMVKRPTRSPDPGSARSPLHADPCQ
jgi:hypothetical protein